MHLRHGFWSSELAGLWVPSDKDAKKNGAVKSPEVGWQGGGGDLSHSSEHFLGKALAPLWTLWQQIPDFCCMPVYTQLFQVRKIKLNSGIQLSPFSLVDFSGGVRPLCIQLQVSNGQKDGGQLSRCKIMAQSSLLGVLGLLEKTIFQWKPMSLHWVLRPQFFLWSFANFGRQRILMGMRVSGCVCACMCSRLVKTSWNSTTQKLQADFLKIVHEENK